MSPDDERHGTPRGYDAHRRDNEEACGPCREAAAAYEYRRRIDHLLGRRYSQHSLGTARRIQALVALGWTFNNISARLGRCHDYAQKLATRDNTIIRSTTAQLVERVYDEMSMALPPRNTPAERRRATYAQTTARRNGWVPPLCWDDIDTDPEPQGYPQGVWTPRYQRPTDGPDPVVVTRILAGDWRLKCSPAEKAAVAARWVELGRSTTSLKNLTGWRVERYYKIKDVA